MLLVLLIIGCLIVAGLAFYAGRLLLLLSKQNQQRQQALDDRIDNLLESIVTISKAMLQQQCELSEGAIRICNLLQALPLNPSPDYSSKFPAIFTLFSAISGFATLEARRALDKRSRMLEDRQRQEIESQHETLVLNELESIIQFCTEING
ncbi:DUF2489 domain-containing protein [Alteromonas sp. 5E99-2]|uniref:DUF2489 domain-containing protein n=1 Tax=Alteromonas sp. 5E99-2 TaxID=2817683 RepID=UPI001A99C30D|nr:DUF2489 domain-containing protein [Alteromonas sp. 5E99-2]MBO1256798.1 DUF2489 domain-containing protein [Alteromonas sp. 5E99-2]